MALLHLALSGRPAQDFIALTVDHGLRPEARDEARDVKARCSALGVRHETLVWAPSGGPVSQARARRGRHQLLATALRQAGGTHLLLGHTLDDQYETLWMRRQRSEAGLAGMRSVSVSPVWPEGRGVFLGRPLLAARRSELRDVLRAASETWVEDPSNLDLKFERVRAREALAAESPGGLEAVHQKYCEAVAQRQRCDRRLVEWFDRHVEAYEDGLVVCETGGLDASDLAAGLGHLILAASGTDRPAGFSARLELAEDMLGNRRAWRSRTLGGAWLAPRQGRIHIARDPGLIPDRLDRALPYIWDGRFEIQARGEEGVDSGAKAAGFTVLPLAKPSFPQFLHKNETMTCLVPERLDSVKWILGHETCGYAC